jgi:minichromosome maintenance protein 10
LDHKPKGSSEQGSTARRALQNANSSSRSIPKPVPDKLVEIHQTRPAPSNVLAKLASLNRRPIGDIPAEAITRSSGFAESPPTDAGIDLGPSGGSNAPQRDDRLALVEDLQVGPVDHKPSFDDPNFEQLEPNSGIRLLCVSVSLANHVTHYSLM